VVAFGVLGSPEGVSQLVKVQQEKVLPEFTQYVTDFETVVLTFNYLRLSMLAFTNPTDCVGPPYGIDFIQMIPKAYDELTQSLNGQDVDDLINSICACMGTCILLVKDFNSEFIPKFNVFLESEQFVRSVAELCANEEEPEECDF